MSDIAESKTEATARETKKRRRVTVELISGVEGLAVYVNNYRITGPKPWGGGNVVKAWIVDRYLIEEALANE